MTDVTVTTQGHIDPRSPHTGPSSPSLHSVLALGPVDPPSPWSQGLHRQGTLKNKSDADVALVFKSFLRNCMMEHLQA